MTEEFTDKSIKNVPFSGKRADYEKWAKRFLSYAQMKKVKQILLGKEKPPSTTGWGHPENTCRTWLRRVLKTERTINHESKSLV